jgi:hypothetical protein
MTHGDLVIWDVDELARREDLDGVLVRADYDHRLTRPAMLLVRSETTARRTICVTTPEGSEAAAVEIRPAVRTPSVKHPLGKAPMDSIIGPVGAGLITYLPSARGLRVLAYDIPGKDHGHATT